MTVLSAIQGASVYCGVTAPAAVYGEVDRVAVEFAEIANEAAAMIADEHDWQLLKRLHTITGDGTATAFDLPADYLRMPKAQNLWTSRLESPLRQVLDHDEWLQLDIQAAEVVLNVWTVLGGQIQFRPALETGETVKLYYQSNLWANDGSADTAAFAADADTFRLDDRLLKHAIAWMWRAKKGLPYEDDLERYNDALGKRVAEDKGAKILAIGTATRPRGVRVAYPRVVTS